MILRETNGEKWELLRLRESNGDSWDSETTGNSWDHWTLMRLKETTGDIDSERLLYTHEAQRE